MTIKCIIVDDEPLAIEAIEDHINKFDNLKIIAKCADAIEAFTIIKKQRPDLLFLDIEMPEMNGMTFIKTLKNPPKVIFTTAYREYATEAFDLDVIDYLLKPISFERFMRAINRFYDTYTSNVQNVDYPVLAGKAYLQVYANGKTHKIDLEKVFYIESLNDYIQIYLSDEKIITRESISEIEKKLPEDLFLRIHRSYIVSIEKIESYTKGYVEIKSKVLTISRKYKDNVLGILNYK